MSSRNLKRFAVSGGTAALVLACLLFSGSGSIVGAHSEDDETQNGLQGTWHLQLTVRDCQTGQMLRPPFPALITFAKGGTLTVTTAGQLPSLFTPGLGVWQHTAHHTYSAVSEQFVFNSAGVFIQVHRLTRNIEIGNNRDEFTDSVKLQIFDTTGNQIATGCATSTGTRFEF